MPALEMAQDTGKILRWLKREGDAVNKGEPIMEIETDKVTVEIEATASGVLTNITAREGDVVPVGKTIALIVGKVETLHLTSLHASPVARKIAEEHGVDLARVKPTGGRIEKADVMAYLTSPSSPRPPSPSPELEEREKGVSEGRGLRVRSSPKARRLASERGIDLATLHGSGPAGAIIASDIPSAPTIQLTNHPTTQPPTLPTDHSTLPTIWRVMAERMTTSWTTAPHFYLVREVNASRLAAWRAGAQRRAVEKITYTDLLVKLVAVALRAHPRLNAAWCADGIALNEQVNLGLATATDAGLLVPVIFRADTLTLNEIAARRREVVARAQAGKLKLTDLQGGTFTLSNLGMYGVDAFNAIVNPPQAAILAVGRIAERVVALQGAPAVQPMLTLTLTCDHRVVDGARGAQFLDTLAQWIEEPLGLLE